MALNPSSGWSYYKEIQISDTANASADYQMKLTIYAGTGDDNTADGIIYCDNHCEDFPNDIRFGTANDPSTATQLAQWIEESDATSAIIWVKCPSDGSDTFYMFVGNSSAGQYSSADDTFIYFTHFDTDKSGDFRTVGSANYTWETSYSRLKGTYTGNTWQMHQLKTAYSRPIAIETRFKQNYLDWHCDAGIGYGKSSTTNIDGYQEIEGYHFNLRSSTKMTLRITKTSGREDYNTNAGSFSQNTWYRATLELGTSEIHAYVYDNNNDKLEVTHSDSTFDNLYPGISTDLDSGGTDYWDFFFLRKYADSPPTWSSFSSWIAVGSQAAEFKFGTILKAQFKFRKKLTVSNSTADYPMRIVIFYRQGNDDPSNEVVYCDYHSENFPYDIRFSTNSDGWPLLPQFLDRYEEGGIKAISYDSTIFGQAGQGIAMDSEYFYGINNYFIAVTKISDGKSIKAAFQYDASEDAYTDYTSQVNSWSESDVKPFPYPMGTNDAFYIGLYNKFTSLWVYIKSGDQGDGAYSVTWEYWNGSSWVALPNLTDETDGFKNDETNYVYWDRPSDWVECTVNGVTAYWIRARLTSVGGSYTNPTLSTVLAGRYTKNDGNYTQHLSDGHVLSHGGEEYLYVAGCNYPNTPKTGGVYKYKLATDSSQPLEYLGEILNLSSESCPGYLAGVDKFEVDGKTYWWLIFDVWDTSSSNPSKIWRYDYDESDDTNWSNKTEYNLTYYHSGYNYQGFTWWEDPDKRKYIICPAHEGASPNTIDIYRWNGNGFEKHAQVSKVVDPNGEESSQGTCRSYSGGNYLYFATRKGGTGSPILKGEISYQPQYAVYWVKLPSTAPSSIYLFTGCKSAGLYSANAGDFFYWYDDFSGNYHSLNDYTIVDHGDRDTPSNWEMDTTNNRIIQHSNIYDSGSGFGSVLLTGLNVDNFRIFVRIKEVDNDEIGILFSYQSESQYYSFMYQNETTPHWGLGKDAFNRRASSWLDSTNTPVPSRTAIYEFKILKVGSSLKVYRRDAEEWTEILSATDSTYSSGDIGLATGGCDEGEFRHTFVVAKAVLPEPAWSSTESWEQTGLLKREFILSSHLKKSILHSLPQSAILNTRKSMSFFIHSHLLLRLMKALELTSQLLRTEVKIHSIDSLLNILQCSELVFDSQMLKKIKESYSLSANLGGAKEVIHEVTSILLAVKSLSVDLSACIKLLGIKSAEISSLLSGLQRLSTTVDSLLGKLQKAEVDINALISRKSGVSSLVDSLLRITKELIVPLSVDLLKTQTLTINISTMLSSAKLRHLMVQSHLLKTQAKSTTETSLLERQLLQKVAKLSSLLHLIQAKSIEFSAFFTALHSRTHSADTLLWLTKELQSVFSANLWKGYSCSLILDTSLIHRQQLNYYANALLAFAFSKKLVSSTLLQATYERKLYHDLLVIRGALTKQSAVIKQLAENLTIFIPTIRRELYVWCSRWDEDNWRATVEIVSDKWQRDLLVQNTTPGAVAELYNILGEPKYWDTTFTSGNTLFLYPNKTRPIAQLRDPVKVAVKSYKERMLTPNKFYIKLDLVKL